MAGMPPSTPPAGFYNQNGREGHYYNAAESDGEEFGPPSSTLSVNFSAPLSGAQRVEKIQQMVKGHPAFKSSQRFQEFLFKAQTSLRRMPGISSGEAKEISSQLQELGHIVSRDTTRLIESFANTSLDYEDNEKVVQKLSFEANKSKKEFEAKYETKSANFDKLYNNYSEERVQREKYEADVKSMTLYLKNLSSELAAIKAKAMQARDSTSEADVYAQNELIQDLDAAISDLDGRLRFATGVSPDDDQQASNALVPVNGQSAMSLANKDVLTDRLKSLGLFDPNAELKSPRLKMERNGMTSRSPAEQPTTPRSLQSAQTLAETIVSRTPPHGRQNVTPHTAPPRADVGHQYNRSQESFWGFNGSNGGRGGRNRSNTISRPGSCQPYNGPITTGQWGPTPRYQPNNGPPFNPNSIFSPGPRSPIPRPPTAFDSSMNGGRDFQRHTPRLSGGRDRKNSIMHLPDPFQGGSGNLPGRNGYSMSPTPQQHSPGIQLTERAVQAWQKQVRGFYLNVHQFVQAYASSEMPSVGFAAVQDSGLWRVLLKTYNPMSDADSQSYLEHHFQQRLTRYCLVTRVIIDYVVNLIWIPGAWKGADRDSTEALSQLEQDLEKAEGMPAYLRQPLLDRQAAIIDKVMQKNGPTSDFIQKKINVVTRALVTNLDLMMSPHNNPMEAYNALQEIACQAYDLSSKMLTSRLNFDYRFPLIGSRFSCGSMIAIFPEEVDQLELQARHWRVSLVTTPVITCRNDTGNDISAHAVAHADVYCMQ